jgi:2-oxoglutarate dehydrogenase E1 component
VATDPIDDLNSGFVQELLADYLASPESVAPQWRALFEARPELVLERLPNGARLRELSRDGAGGNGAAAAAPAPAPAEAPAPGDDLLLGGVAAAMSRVKAHRTHGHLAAHIDPLGSSPPSDPALDPDRLEPRLTPELQAQIPAKFLRLYVPADNLAEALPKLRETYCGTLAFELEHISSHEQRLWLRAAIESGRYRQPLGAEEKRVLLARLSQVEGFERFLRRAFLGQKQFSIEGLDVMVPMLDEAIELAAANGATHVVIGMAHRGRLNVLAHTVGREVDAILREFEGERVLEAIAADLETGSGDVK